MNLQNLYTAIASEYQPVLERFCNQEAILRKFVLRFPEDKTFQELAAAVEAGDYPQIEGRAHALKGVAANLGFEQLTENCGELVLCVRNNQPENISDLFGQVEAAYGTVCHAIGNMTEE